MTRPNWNDDDAIIAWVAQIIEDEDAEEEREFMTRDWSGHPGIPVSDVHDSMEREALTAAQSGNYKLLDQRLA